jgi:heat shock protein HslJ
MFRPIALLIAAVLAITVAACSSSGTGGHSISGTAWTVTSVGGQAAVAASPPTIQFGADGTIHGTTGCNQYNGTYTTDGEKLTVGPLATTRMACADPAVNTQEAAFTTAMSGTTSWAIGSDGNLTIKGSADIVAKPGATT